ncbi:hypothetical protein [Hyalangium gracile]|uniref:hypothetical protein n=1 Tax=Hyalangium gracile TaxID=394092 RepID=UPI001CCF4FC2|nr:hypothetical protein [Hyalangium gracile]
MSLDKVWFSFIDYRPDPSEPEKNRIVLGSILSARLGRRHGTVVLDARDHLTEDELQHMDGLSRKLLAYPEHYLDGEIQRFLKTAPFDGQSWLSALSQLHRWSLYVTPPRKLQVERHLSQTNQEALTTVCHDLLIAHMLGRDVPLTGRLRAKRIIPDDWRTQVPPAWQLTSRSFAAASQRS